MAIHTTDAAYNDSSREVQMRYDIYFNDDDEPLVVTRDNYLISSTGLEEAQSDSDAVISTVSSNEISFELLNEDRLFTPTNQDSPYYRKIRKDIRVVAYGRVVMDEEIETEWDPLGTYYVKEWSTTSSGLIATVSADDILYNIFDAPMPVYQVQRNVPSYELFESFFGFFDVNADVDHSIFYQLSYAFINDDNKDFLSQLTNGTLALCFGNREGGVTVLSRLGTFPLRATLTDADQIIDVTTKQTIDVGYDGTSVVRNTPYASSVVTILSNKDQELAPGVQQLGPMKLSASPLYCVSYATVTDSVQATVTKYSTTPNTITLTVESAEENVLRADINAFGKVLETTVITDADSGTNLLTLDSKYVQTAAQADRCKAYLQRVVANRTPTLTVSVRGNFRLKIGDKIRVNSEKYKTDFTGIIVRSSYNYDGGLTGSLTLVDAALFGEVTS